MSSWVLAAGVERRRHRHGQHLEGAGVHGHHDAPLGLGNHQRLYALPVGHELDLAVDGQDQIGARHGGLYLGTALRDQLPSRRPLGQHPSGNAGEKIVVLGLDTLDTIRIGVDEPHHVCSERSVGVYPLGLGQEVDPGQLESLHLGRGVGIDLAGDELEGGVRIELVPERLDVNIEQLAQYGRRSGWILDLARVRIDGAGLGSDGELPVLPVEYGSANRRCLLHPDQLAVGGFPVNGRVYDLNLVQLVADEEPAPDEDQCYRQQAHVGRLLDEASRLVGRHWPQPSTVCVEAPPSPTGAGPGADTGITSSGSTIPSILSAIGTISQGDWRALFSSSSRAFRSSSTCICACVLLISYTTSSTAVRRKMNARNAATATTV